MRGLRCDATKRTADCFIGFARRERADDERLYMPYAYERWYGSATPTGYELMPP